MRRALSLVLSVVVSAALVCSCTGAAKVEDYLGEYDYDAPAVCMVYEPVEGEFDEEGNALYGIQYREVTDLDGLLKVPDTTFLLYFYNSLDSSGWAITAVVEDIAEAEEGARFRRRHPGSAEYGIRRSAHSGHREVFFFQHDQERTGNL